jgi:hypothetical protein
VWCDLDLRRSLRTDGRIVAALVIEQRLVRDVLAATRQLDVLRLSRLSDEALPGVSAKLHHLVIGAEGNPC